jgi:peptidoglycan/LPS O-acetylase OafA/YrhL
MNNLTTVLDRHRGIGPGFDFLRVFLATCIVSVHAVLLTGNRASLEASVFWFLEYALVPMFFALSGFLITGSAKRLSIGNFLINRGLRIIPALAVDIFVCALVIGPIMTTTPLSSYFFDSDFFRYFLNITGYIHYKLPGVFTSNLSTNVNGALWTVPYEILCYAIISVFIVFGWLKGKWKVLCLATLMMASGFAISHTRHTSMLPHSVDSTLFFLLLSRESQIVTAFLLGVAAYQWKDWIPYDWRILAVCVGACCMGAVLPRLAQSIGARFFLLPALSYITVFIGLTKIKIPSYFIRGDYSYGIYLYHDPFLQIVIALFPALALVPLRGAVFVFAVGYSMVLVVSNISWNFIERPILQLRKKFSFVARVRDLEPKGVAGHG